jgi:hypothetical protein
MDPMRSVKSTPAIAPEQLIAIAMSVHNIVGRMPVAIKARGKPGVIIADGRPKYMNRGSQALDGVFDGESVKRTNADCGGFTGIPMYSSAIFDESGKAVAAIGVIDTSGILGLHEFAEIGTSLCRQYGNHDRPKK